MSDAPKEEAAAEEPSGGGGSKLGLILILVNTLAVAGVMGLAVYTKLLYKKPQITEDQERERLEAQRKQSETDRQPVLHEIKPFMVNIRPDPGVGPSTDGANPKVPGRVRYVNIGITLEVTERVKEPVVTEIKPVLLDRILNILGKKQAEELTNVQGRYLLRTQIRDMVNETAKDTVVSNVYFTQFSVH